jgi:DNA-binding YbaB/EbfC family protein
MNIQKMMKQAQEMQKKLQQQQEEMQVREFEGASGGGMAKVTINGKGQMLKLQLDDSLIDVEEKEMLEDLIVAAFNDAKHKADEAMSDSMSDITGGLQLPPGMKLPF